MLPRSIHHHATVWHRWSRVLLVLALILVGAGCTKKLKAQRHLSRGEKAFQAEQYDRAEIEYLNVLKQSPLNPTAVSRLGLIYQAEGRWLPAVSFLRKAAEIGPNNSQVCLKLGLSYMALHRAKEAGQQAAVVLTREPTNDDALILLADAAMTTNDIQAAWRRLHGQAEPLKNRAAWHLACGTLYGRTQDLQHAESEFKRALALDPKCGTAYLALSTVYLLRNDRKQAEAALQTAAGMAPLRSALRIRYASFQVQAGQSEQAKQSILDMMKKAPDYNPGWMFLADTAFREHKNDECDSYLQRVLSRDPINYEALMLKGNLYMTKGQSTNGLAQFERVLALYGSVPQVHYEIALAHLLNQNPSKAAASLRQALAANPDFPEAILLLAQLDLRKGDTLAAIDSLNQLLKKKPQIAGAYTLLASAYLAQKSPDQATAILQRMAASFPHSPDAFLLLGNVLTQGRKTREARSAFERCLELAPDYLPALEQIVDLDLTDKDYAAAAARVQEQMKKTPEAGEPWLLMAKIHLQQSSGHVAQEVEKNPALAHRPVPASEVGAAKPDLDLAEAALKKAIELNPNLKMAYLLLAQMYVVSHRERQALERLDSLTSKTNDIAGLMLKGMIYDEMKDYPSARGCYEKLLSLYPTFNPAMNNLAYLYSARFGDLDKAYQLAEQARQLQPADPFTADTLGWILYRKGQFARALGLIEESALKQPRDPEIQFHLGMTRYMMGDEEQAQSALQRAAEGEKDFPDRAEIQKRLSILAVDAKAGDPAIKAKLEMELKSTPDDPVLLTRLGLIRTREGATEAAANTFRAVLKRNPGNSRAMLLLANLYYDQQHDRARALELVREAHALRPDDPRVSHLLARLVFEEGTDFTWASSLIEESARKLPSDADVLYDLAWCRYSVGRVAEAEAAMDKAAVVGKEFAKLSQAQQFLRLCHACRDGTGAEKAVAEAQQVLVHEPENVPALLVTAMVSESRREYEKAAALYERILAKYPLFMPAVRNLAILEGSALGKDEKAWPLATRAREAFPRDTEVARVLGMLAFRRGDFARSKDLLTECTTGAQPDPELLYYLGMSQFRLKNWGESRARLQQALAMKVEPALAEEARRILKDLK